jgi:iron complex transport system permease protein
MNGPETSQSPARPLSIAAQEALAAGERLHVRHLIAAAILIGALALAATLGMSIGAVSVPFDEVWRIVWSHLGQTGAAAASVGAESIIWEIRFPRVLLGGLVGAGLSVLGVAVQAMVRNPLADPYTLGVESGASAGAVGVIYYAGVLAVTTSGVAPVIGAFLGALGTIALVFALSRSNGRVSAIRLLLVGVSLSYALSGFTSFVLYSTRDFGAQAAIMFWMLGGLGVADWARLPVITMTLVVGLGYLWYQARALNALALGDDSATALGLDPNLLRTRLFLVCSLVVAAIVSTVGPIGFVGLVVPHIARLLIGADHRRVIPASLVLGATYLIGVDIVARSIFAPSEIPVGVVTAMLGTPFFLWLIRRRGSSALKEAA